MTTTPDTQARALAQSLRKRFEPDRNSVTAYGTISLTRAEFDLLDAYLATPAGSTERPSDAAIAQADERFRWALDQGGILADWCNEAGDALRELLRAYERRVRSACDTPEALASEPWRCAEFVGAEHVLKRKPVAVVELAASRPPAKEAEAAGDAPVAMLKGVDEYGPMLDWFRHWAEFAPGTKLYTRPAPPAVAVGVSADDVMFACRAYDAACGRLANGWGMQSALESFANRRARREP